MWKDRLVADQSKAEAKCFQRAGGHEYGGCAVDATVVIVVWSKALLIKVMESKSKKDVLLRFKVENKASRTDAANMAVNLHSLASNTDSAGDLSEVCSDGSHFKKSSGRLEMLICINFYSDCRNVTWHVHPPWRLIAVVTGRGMQKVKDWRNIHEFNEKPDVIFILAETCLDFNIRGNNEIRRELLRISLYTEKCLRLVFWLKCECGLQHIDSLTLLSFYQFYQTSVSGNKSSSIFSSWLDLSWAHKHSESSKTIKLQQT